MHTNPMRGARVVPPVEVCELGRVLDQLHKAPAVERQYAGVSWVCGCGG
jgi:hypothetical protein